MSRRAEEASSPARVVPSKLPDLLQLVAAACLLALCLSIFRQPLDFLRRDLAPATPGFLMQITSVPAGAEVEVDGSVRGQTPFFGNVDCRPEETVRLRVTAPGYAPWERQVPCRQGNTLRATARLERAD